MTLSVSHNLEKEFPQLSTRLKELKESDPHFQQTYLRYVALDKEITHFETDSSCADSYLEGLKKERLVLKDKLYFALTHP